jgi:hypothetical protein
VLCAFDLIELEGKDLRRAPIEHRKHRLAKLIHTPRPGIVVNEHYEDDGEIVFTRACKLGYEGIVSKRLGSPYRSGRPPHWLKIKNPKAPAVSARPRRIGGANPLSPTKGEHLRAAITCLAETNPPWPTRLRRSKRRLRHNQERSHAYLTPPAKGAIPKGPYWS